MTLGSLVAASTKGSDETVRPAVTITPPVEETQSERQTPSGLVRGSLAGASDEFGSLEALVTKLRQRAAEAASKVSVESIGEGKEQAKASVVITRIPEEDASAERPEYNELQLQKANTLREEGQFQDAIQHYGRVLDAGEASQLIKQSAMLGLAQTFVDMNAPERSISILEDYLQRYPRDEYRPELIYKLGLLYRDIGLHQESVAMFYQVLNNIVADGEKDFDRYLRFGRLVMFEIGRSHVELGHYEVALEHFQRIDNIKMHPRDQETIAFYIFLCLSKTENYDEALKAAQSFVQRYPESRLRPEVMCAQGQIMFKLGRSEDAIAALIDLLESAEEITEAEMEDWMPWKQKAGNLIANQLFKDGDYAAALSVYQGLATLEEDYSWQLPVIYQIGICFERLHLRDRAKESYSYILAASEKVSSDEAESLRPIADGARWRLKILGWVDDTTRRKEEWAGN